eukprot:5278655-Amphidinium_carterae.1
MEGGKANESASQVGPLAQEQSASGTSTLVKGVAELMLTTCIEATHDLKYRCGTHTEVRVKQARYDSHVLLGPDRLATASAARQTVCAK